MKSVLTTPQFDKWFDGLRDSKTKRVIQTRIDRLEEGFYGDYKHLEAGVMELRIFFGAGYRIYFVERAGEVIILLAGGDKSTQSRDIKKAVELSRDI